MRARLLIFALAFVFCLLWLSVQTGAAFSRARLEKESHQTFTLTSTGHVKLDNLNGIVRISAWDRGEIQVDAVKSAETEAELDEVKIEIDSKPEHIRIHTKYPTTKWSLWKRNNSTIVEYDLKVPVHAVLEHIENVNGRIEIEGVQGRVHASTVNGRMSVNGLVADADLDSDNGGILVTFDNLEAVHCASLKTVNGRVSLTLPSDANVELSAHTLNGRISSGLDVAATKHWPIGSDLHGTLGKGGTRIHAETVNGSIQLRRAEAGKNGRQSESQQAESKPEKEE